MKSILDKLNSIKNKDVLVALDLMITSNITHSDIVQLTYEQELMLEMSEEDIKNGDLISQEAMDKRNLVWLSK